MGKGAYWPEVSEKSERRGFFDRPLWRIIVPIILLSFAIHRAAIAVVASMSAAHGLVVAGYIAQALIALVVAGALFAGRPRIT